MGILIGLLFLLLLAVAYDSISVYIHWLPALYWEPAAIVFLAALLITAVLWLLNTPKEIKTREIWVFLISFLVIAAFVIIGGMK